MMAAGPRRSVAVLGLTVAFAAGGFDPPHWRDGALPQVPQQTLAWGQVFLEVSVTATGEVEQATVLRSTPSFTEKLRAAVAGWRFEPATAEGTPLRSHVLVGAVFRPPTLLDAPAPGEPPRDLSVPTDSIPFPTSIATPVYPPRSLGDGVVLVEVTVGGDGAVQAATVLRSAPGFDESAETASLRWRFRPARRNGDPISSRAFLVFAFRQPVISR
jgi:TonB family protein